MKTRNIIGLIVVIVSTFCVITTHGQTPKKKPAHKKVVKYIKPVIVEEKNHDTMDNNAVQAAPGTNSIQEPPAAPGTFDYEAFKEDTRRSDSLQKALGIFLMADSMAKIVLKHYADTARHPDKTHNPLRVEHYSRYYQQIVMKPYKGIWHVWYYFQDDQYHGKEEHPYHSKPKEFPYHFEIIVDQKKGTTTLFKGVFSEYYIPE